MFLLLTSVDTERSISVNTDAIETISPVNYRAHDRKTGTWENVAGTRIHTRSGRDYIVSEVYGGVLSACTPRETR